MQVSNQAPAGSLAFPMYVVEASTLLTLDKLVPHQHLRNGKLTTHAALVNKYGKDGFCVVFFSHMWTANAEPDHTGTQLRIMKKTLARIMEGKLPPAPASMAGFLAFGQRSITSTELARLTRYKAVFA